MLSLPTSSSPPPGSRGRKLAELLEEQQEPFALEAYLLEKGYYCCYSERLVASSQAAVCGWPMDACDRLLQRLLASNGFGRRRKRRKRCHRLLKSVLAKLLNPKEGRRVLNGRDNKVLHFSGAMDGGDDKVSSSGLGGFQGKMMNPWNWMEVDDSKQLSPVSVLDQLRSSEGSPVHNSDAKEEDDISTMEVDPPSKDFTACNELLELPHNTPPFIQFSKSTRHLDAPEKLLGEEEEVEEVEEEEEEEEGEEEEEEEEMVGWKKMEEAEAESTRQLAFTDISRSKRKWYEFHPHAKEIGIHIEEAIFDVIKGDVISELLVFHCN